MNSDISTDQYAILQAAQRLGVRANWYTIGRVVLADLSSPAAFEKALRSLLDSGLLLEMPAPSGTVAGICMTDAGLIALASKS
jgi:hypothetical protein